MNRDVVISIFEVVGSPFCVSSIDGQKVYDRLALALESGKSVELSFHNVGTLTSAFLNAATGQLYGKFEPSQLSSLLHVVDASNEDLGLLKRVNATAKEYFADPGRFNRINKETMRDV